jgi:multimeric flavodoxin WrbA
MEDKMKVLAINSSPRSSGQSKTELLLSHLVEGMRAAGAQVEVISLRQKRINHCSGCFTCWTKTPGVCIHKDEMALELFPKWLNSDMVVYASLLYHFLVNARMKTFIERTLPALMPFLEPAGDRTTHPVRHQLPNVVVLSVAGFPEDSVFDALSLWAKTVFRKGLLAELYRPAAESLVNSTVKDDVLNAFEQAGKELVMQKAVSMETMQRIKQPVADAAQVRALANSFWQTMVTEGLSPEEADTKGIVPRPNSLEAMMYMLSLGFNPQKAVGKKGVLQFRFTGEVQGDFYLVIDEKGCTPHIGRAEKADCPVDSPFEVWADIVEGKADGGQIQDWQIHRSGEFFLPDDFW